MTKARIQTKDMVAAALCAAIIAVCSQIQFPMPGGVPVTLQTFAVALCGFLLAPKFAAAAIAVYLLLGAVGVPVFAGLSGGFQVLIGMTGGFLFGFIALAVLGALSKKTVPSLLLSLLGLGVCHAAGIFQFMLVTHMGFGETVMAVSAPFILKDILSVLVALLIAMRVRPLLRLSEK